MKRLSMILLLILLFLFTGQINGYLLQTSDLNNSFKLPDYDKFVLNNGLTVYLMEEHEVPLVYVSFVFPSGAVNDEDKYGLASLTAEGLLFGTKNYTKKQIEENLDFIGASYETSASKEFSEISMSYINTDQEIVLPILKDIVTSPAFDGEEFAKRKKRLLVKLEQAKERPRIVIGSYYDKFLFEDHPYGNPLTGTIKSVSGISVNDLKEFYKLNYFPDGSAISIVGDIDITKMKDKVIELFQDWKTEGTETSIAAKPIPSFNKSRLLLVNKEDATETRFLIGSLGIKRSNPDYIAIQVVNTVLGGRFTSWLNDELRVNRGLTYGAGSKFFTHKNSGTFVIRSFTHTKTTIEAVDVALEVLDRLHNQGIDIETLNSAKNFIKGKFPLRYETAGDLASLLTSMYIYNFDESFINDFQKNVDEMTIQKAQQIVKKYFPEDNLQYVLIGKASELRETARKYGQLTEKEIKADGF